MIWTTTLTSYNMKQQIQGINLIKIILMLSLKGNEDKSSLKEDYPNGKPRDQHQSQLSFKKHKFYIELNQNEIQEVSKLRKENENHMRKMGVHPEKIYQSEYKKIRQSYPHLSNQELEDKVKQQLKFKIPQQPPSFTHGRSSKAFTFNKLDEYEFSRKDFVQQKAQRKLNHQLYKGSSRNSKNYKYSSFLKTDQYRTQSLYPKMPQHQNKEEYKTPNRISQFTHQHKTPVYAKNNMNVEFEKGCVTDFQQNRVEKKHQIACIQSIDRVSMKIKTILKQIEEQREKRNKDRITIRNMNRNDKKENYLNQNREYDTLTRNKSPFLNKSFSSHTNVMLRHHQTSHIINRQYDIHTYLDEYERNKKNQRSLKFDFTNYNIKKHQRFLKNDNEVLMEIEEEKEEERVEVFKNKGELCQSKIQNNFQNISQDKFFSKNKNKKYQDKQNSFELVDSKGPQKDENKFLTPIKKQMMKNMYKINEEEQQNNSQSNDVQQIMLDKKLLEFAELFRVQIDFDMNLREAKIMFSNLNSSEKWQNVQKQFLLRKYPVQNVKQMLTPTLQQNNPFSENINKVTSANVVVNQYIKCEQFWKQNIQKSQSNTFLQMIHKYLTNNQEYLIVEDLVRFVNMQMGTFYRNRDLILIFRRIDKKDRIQYNRFVQIMSK